MRRWALRILFPLLLGVIVNIAVAWGSKCLAPANYAFRGVRTDVGLDPNTIWSQFASRSWIPGELGRVDEVTALGEDYRIVVAEDYGHHVPEGEDCILYTFASGLPFRSLGSSTLYKLARQDVQSCCGVGLPQQVPVIGGNWYPICPIWPGFAINTVFYAAVLWLLFAAPFALRRRRRIKRGLCPKCAYDLRGHGRSADATACPECGALR